MTQAVLTVLGLVGIPLGLFFLAHAARALWRRSWVWRGGLKAQGKLIALKRCASGVDEPDFYTPIVRFRDQKNREHDIELLVTSNPNKYSVGSPIEVIYQASNPKNFIHIGSTLEEATIILVNLGLAAAVLLFSYLALTGQIEIV